MVHYSTLECLTSENILLYPGQFHVNTTMSEKGSKFLWHSGCYEEALNKKQDKLLNKNNQVYILLRYCHVFQGEK